MTSKDAPQHITTILQDIAQRETQHAQEEAERIAWEAEQKEKLKKTAEVINTARALIQKESDRLIEEKRDQDEDGRPTLEFTEYVLNSHNRSISLDPVPHEIEDAEGTITANLMLREIKGGNMPRPNMGGGHSPRRDRILLNVEIDNEETTMFRFSYSPYGSFSIQDWDGNTDVTTDQIGMAQDLLDSIRDYQTTAAIASQPEA